MSYKSTNTLNISLNMSLASQETLLPYANSISLGPNTDHKAIFLYGPVCLWSTRRESIATCSITYLLKPHPVRGSKQHISLS